MTFEKYFTPPPLLDVPPKVRGHLHGRSEKAELLRSSDSGTVLCVVSIRVLESVVAMGTKNECGD